MRKVAKGLSLAALFAAGVVLVMLANGAKPANDTPERTAITGVRLFDGTRTIGNATVVFDESGILSVCSGCSAPKGTRIVDGRGRTLLPGLIDAHTHTWGDALERALAFGVTTEIDMFTAAQFAAQRRAEQKKGPVFDRADLISAGTLVTVAGGHGTEYGVPIATFAKGMDPQKFIDDRIAEGSDFIKIVYDDGHAFRLDFPTLDKGDLGSLIAAAHRRGKLAVVHISTAAEAMDAVMAGADGLVHAWGDTTGDDAIFAEMARRKMFVIPTLSVIGSLSGQTGESLASHAVLKARVSADDRRALSGRFPATAINPKSLETAQTAVRRLGALRVPILAGTDAPNPGTAHGLSIHRELELLTGAGLSPMEALRSATSVPAAAFKLADRGRIEKGKRADLLLVSGDPTTDITATRNIVAVWKNGREFNAPDASTPPAPRQSNFAGGVVSDFENGSGSELGTEWMTSTDQIMGGKSTGDLSVGPAEGRSGKVLRFRGVIGSGTPYPWSGAMLMMDQRQFAPVDFRPLKTISFSIRNPAPARLMVFASRLGRVPVVRDLPASSDWTTVSVPFAALGLDGSDIQGILVSGTAGEFTFELDDVSIDQ
jgi:imidazolonepropionase-like amidohydrolase